MRKVHLGINLGHDRSAAIVQDGQIMVAIQQERLDRHRYSIGYMQQSAGDDAQIQLPDEAIRYCLDSMGLELQDVATITANMPGIDHGPAILRRSLPKDQANKVATIPSHHLAHAYAAYWPSGFDAAVVLIADGSGTTSPDRRTESYTLFDARGPNFRTIHSEKVSAHLASLSTLGFVYEYITRKAALVTRAGPEISIPEAGKLMGLAAFGGPQPSWQRWIHPEEGSYHLRISAYDILLEVAALEARYDDGAGAPYLRPYLVDLAYKVQKELEAALLHLVSHAVEKTGLRKVCLGGGIALNSVANYRLLCDLELDDIFVFPASGDAGAAAGCALWAYAAEERGQERAPLLTATLGRRYGEAEIARAVESFEGRIEVTRLSPDEMLRESADALGRGLILARYEGGSEYGPRALGHRSILADPTFERMKDIINARVKFREAFRPFAPVIPKEDIAEVFEHHAASPFMLLVSPLKPDYQQKLPGVTHKDGTGRVQTVTADQNPYLHALCRRMIAVRGGPPVVLNTSLNVAGQPIVETPAEAIATFLSTDIDHLALEDLWITKRGRPVKDYSEHLGDVRPSPLPRGLAPRQPAVTDLMKKLDRALFFGETEGCPWTQEELAALSSEIGLYKETSALFPDSPLGRGFRTELSRRAVLLLDPLGRSSLVDVTASTPPSAWTFEEVRLLFAALREDADGHDEVRIELKLTHRAWARRLEETRARLVPYGLEPRRRARVRAIDSALNEHAEPALAPFADARFSLEALLGRLVERIEGAGYQEPTICALLGVTSLQQIEPTHLGYYDRFRLPTSDVGDLIRLFLLQCALPAERIRGLLGDDAHDALAALGVLVRRGQGWASRIDLYCVEDLLIATDHRYQLFDDDLPSDEEAVMYIGLDSRGLVHTSPREAADRVLDLCTGSGVQALFASRYAREVIGVDTSPRALRFARFNAQLNGARNVRFVLGDLYEAVPRQRFDVILANPPFVPSPRADVRFRDGGPSGEEVLARIIAGAPAALSPVGRLSVVSDLADVEDYEAKLQRWWRGSAAHFLVLQTADRDDLLFSIPHSHAPFGQSFEAYNAELARWVTNFRRSGLRAVNFGYILGRRLPSGSLGAVYRRTIHNPSKPIHHHVEAYFEQRLRIECARGEDRIVEVSPSLHYRIEFARGSQQRRVQLYSPDDPYFTTYDIDEELFGTLLRIERARPTLGAIITQSRGDEICDLLHKGILRLAPGAPMKRDAREESDVAPVPTALDLSFARTRRPPERHFLVREKATLTTPTCLSHYLRR